MKSITYAEFFKGTRIFADMNGWDVAKKPSEIWNEVIDNMKNRGIVDSYTLDVLSALCKVMNYFTFGNDVFAACVNALAKNEDEVEMYSQIMYYNELLSLCINNKCLNKVYGIIIEKLLQHEKQHYDYNNIANFEVLESFVIIFANKYLDVIHRKKVFEYYECLTDKYGQNISLIKEKFRTYIDTSII